MQIQPFGRAARRRRSRVARVARSDVPHLGRAKPPSRREKSPEESREEPPAAGAKRGASAQASGRDRIRPSRSPVRPQGAGPLRSAERRGCGGWNRTRNSQESGNAETRVSTAYPRCPGLSAVAGVAKVWQMGRAARPLSSPARSATGLPEKDERGCVSHLTATVR